MREQARQLEPLGLYLSVPFCRSKCTFCNFASGVYPASKLPLYLRRLMADLAGIGRVTRAARLLLPREVDTVYLGGGTPSILTGDQLRAIFVGVREQFSVTADAEITLEAAPGTLTEELLAAAAELRVTRISFGVQTFVDSEARAIGRLHTAGQALGDLAKVRSAGLAASVDLIAGLPGQTEASWRSSLDTLAEARPEHASVYMFEVDEDSRLGGEMLLGGSRYGAALTPSEDAVADFYTEACLALAAQGLSQYEISNFARPGRASKHNLRYWQRRPYLGLGLDAHSMLRSDDGRAVRFGTGEDLDAYLEAGTPARACTRPEIAPWQDFLPLSRAAEFEEAWFLGLRCTGGVCLPDLTAEFGSQLVATCLPVIEELAADGLLTRAGDRVCLTARGRLLSNDVFSAFLGLAEGDQADRSGTETAGGTPEVVLMGARAR